MTGLALALAVPALAGDAGAQSVTTAPLGANELLLEVNATGSVTSRADIVTIQVQINGSGATVEEARRDAEARIRRVTQAARATGVPAADIEAGEIGTMSDAMTMTMDMNMAAPVDEMVNVAEMNAMESVGDMDMMQHAPSVTANAMVELRLRDIARLDAVTLALGEAGGTIIPVPAYSLADAAGPRREARARALAAARADAEAYAAALGMRVGRVLRVSERAGMDFFTMMTSENAMRRTMNGGVQTEPEIDTSMTIGVDFALAPR